MRTIVCILSVLLASFLWSCRTQKVVVAEKETTTVTVRQRDIPVFTPRLEVNARGKIRINSKGKLKLGGVSVNTSSDKPRHKQPKVNVELDSVGNLNVSVVIPEDTTHVAANDSTIQTTNERNSRVEVEKDNPWWKKALMCVGFFAVMIIIVILARQLKKIM